MKKIWIILPLVLLLAGCKIRQEIKPDTIVDIPLHPTEATVQTVTETEVLETESSTATTAAPTDPTEKESTQQTGSGSKKPTDTKKPSKGSEKAAEPPKTSMQSSTEAPTEKPTKAPTEAFAEVPTEPITEMPTESPTEAPTQAPSYDPSGYTPVSLDRGIADAVNAHRQEAGLSPLSLDTRLCAIASVRAYEVSRVWGPARPDGTSGITVLNEYGYGYSVCAENLYFGAGSAASIVSKWMGSDSRKANVLMEAATTIGVGSYTDADGLTHVAALFVG